MKKAIILCSGGLDSVVTAHYVKKKLNHREIIILFFNYGQKTLVQERKCSKKCAYKLGAEFCEIKLKELGKLSNSLINKKGKAGKIKSLKNTKKESNKYSVPCRNLIFLSYALALAETLRGCDIFTGFKNEGKEAYPDTTEEFVAEMNKLARISSNAKIRILAPLIKMDKEDIILLGKKLGVDFRNTFSCYLSKTRKHCGECLACKLRRAGFYWANEEDNTSYAR